MTFDPTKVKRVRAGRPEGGQFTEKDRDEADVDLGSEEKVRYSFLKEWEELEENFDKNFGELPNKFFNADLRGKVLRKDFDPAEMQGYFDAPDRRTLQKLYSRMTKAASNPDDANMTDEQVRELAEELGLENLREVEMGPLHMKGRGWAAEKNGESVFIRDQASGGPWRQYMFRGDVPRRDTGMIRWTNVPLRELAGAARLNRATGHDGFGSILDVNRPGRWGWEDFLEDRERMRNGCVESAIHLGEVENAQVQGRGFLAQRKRINSANAKKSARVWEDKKNPDKLHQKMMAEHKLGGMFRSVEIDNDVDPEQWEDFQNTVLEVEKKLPPIPADKRPELRVRYLGRHRASGMFWPHTNTVNVDVRDSASTIHELGHHYDIAVGGNASLRPEFTKIARDYGRKLKLPPEVGNKAEYYNTPTEIWARGWQLYARERLGIKGRLDNPEKHERFDFAPFQENPDLKKSMFDYIDKIVAGR